MPCTTMPARRFVGISGGGTVLKKYFCLILSMLSLLLTSCTFSQSNSEVSRLSFSLGLPLPKPIHVEHTDTHEGFHGDGTTWIQMEFSAVQDKTLQEHFQNTEGWSSLPLPKPLDTFLYETQDSAALPQISHGFWYFYDRHEESRNRFSCQELFQRHSFNFNFAIYDADSHILYYLEFDT